MKWMERILISNAGSNRTSSSLTAKNDRAKTVIAVIIPTIFTILFCIYAYRTSYDIFFEADYLHIPFLKALISGNITLDTTLTFFGEHMFPGYNLILSINYYLFHISGNFTAFVSAIFIITPALILNNHFSKQWNGPNIHLYIILIAVNAIMLSPINNLFWGMALAAQIGTTFMLFSACRFASNFESKNFDPWIFILTPFIILLFLGGYAISYIGMTFFAAILWGYHHRLWKQPLALIVIVSTSTLLYAIFVAKFSSLSANSPQGGAETIISIIKFFFVMSGASALGSAFLDQYKSIDTFIICGVIFTISYILFFINFFKSAYRRNVNALDVTIALLLIYSIITIIFVSIFRVRNGVDAAVGQWYETHTKFLPAALMIWFGRVISTNSSVKIPKILSCIAFIATAGFIFVGYKSDWVKGYYIKSWKQDVASKALSLLATPITEASPDVWQTLLWPANMSKPGIDFLYLNNLWIFKNRAILVQGLTDDDWLTSKSDVIIACPVGTTHIAFLAWRPAGTDPSSIRISGNSYVRDVAITNALLEFETPDGLSALKISASNTNLARPLSSQADSRPLVAKIADIRCDLRGPVEHALK